METRHLIDTVVQQTTLLIAQLATSAGIRAPLANIADQVFLDLASEIEQQGVTRNVVADMFGMALRTYQKKVSRLRASVTQTERTLWQSVLQFVRDNGGATRNEVLAAFALDDERHVVAVLADLIATGLVYGTGRGQHAAYRPTSAGDQQRLSEEQARDALLHLIWLEIGDRAGVTRAELRDRFAARGAGVDAALDALIADGRVQVERTGAGERLRTQRVLIPAGSESGWETAVFDHFRAVCTAIANKLRSGGPGSDKQHLIGGTTLCFEVYPGHPDEAEVKGLLARFREEAFEVWNRVSQCNAQHPVPDAERTKVVFYFGQNVIDPQSEMEGEP
jgi:hypothetical protein